MDGKYAEPVVWPLNLLLDSKETHSNIQEKSNLSEHTTHSWQQRS